jgi:sulfide:quinone oxidoreductase
VSDELGGDVEVILIDRADSFVFGFSKLDFVFGRRMAESVVHPYVDIVKPGLRFVDTTIRAIDPDLRRVETDAGSFDGDVPSAPTSIRRRRPG